MFNARYEVQRYNEITGENLGAYANFITPFLKGYDTAIKRFEWHHFPETGWTNETLPEVGEKVIVAELYTNPKRRIAYHSVTMNERQECITPDDDFLMDFDEVYAWMYVPQMEGSENN